ncbi:MAG: cryptochrome/photolyase family protein [Saprospiraceae bacterium]|nr:cryptochrome/photolyase family protein [Saprospiraceae bacterium]
MAKTLRLILGDQLNPKHSWFEEVSDDVIYIMMEMRQETDYVKHHIQKLLAFFHAMRSFRDYLVDQGHSVHYLELSNTRNTQSLTQNLRDFLQSRDIDRLEYQEPDEYRLDQQLLKFAELMTEMKINMVSSEHFFTTRSELQDLLQGKGVLMETFYRSMRKKHEVLMDGDKPLFDRWNFDQENRKAFPKKEEVPPIFGFDYDVSTIFKMIKDEGVDCFGEAEPTHFLWPRDRDDSLHWLKLFLQNALSSFGTYQDAMTDRHWYLFHSRLSFSLNSKMLNPSEVISGAIETWDKNRSEITFSQLEGFVRQILGWREFMRGIYWWKMPEYRSENFFNHKRPLPVFFWTAETKMYCVAKSVEQSLKYAYAHHIQRLMITGNFALLAGIHPDEVDAWYLGIYIDAIEWVEITNTRGMSQFADGGLIATKPYVSSANYINKMGDYCSNCSYDHKKKTGDNACPFNSLYWHFLDKHQQLLKDNARMKMMYRLWDKKNAEEKVSLLEQASIYLNQVDEL